MNFASLAWLVSARIGVGPSAVKRDRVEVDAQRENGNGGGIEVGEDGFMDLDGGFLAGHVGGQGGCTGDEAMGGLRWVRPPETTSLSTMFRGVGLTTARVIWRRSAVRAAATSSGAGSSAT